ncbi:hypothetical protein ACOBV9_23185 (plasmid) [Pseudoalteromonas espejiana]
MDWSARFWQNATPIDEQTSTINIENSILDSQQKGNELNNANTAQQRQDIIEPSRSVVSTPITEEQVSLDEVANVTAPVASSIQQAASNTDEQDDNTSTIDMVFNDESWVEIHDGEGERIAFGVKKPWI